MRFAILGPVEVGTDDGQLLIKNGRERLVLALLLLSADRLTPTDRLIDALWDEPPPTARAQLHNTIGSLRRRLDGVGAKLIVTRPLGYEFQLGDHELDLLEFRRLVARGRQAAVEGDAAQAADTFEAALALWRGPALADVDKVLAARPRSLLSEERAAAAEDLLKARLGLGQPDDVLGLVPALIEENPHRERLYEMQMRALAATGRRADALDTYQQAYHRLADDLGVEPGPALRELEQQVLQGVDVAPTAPTVVTPRQLPAMLTTLTGRDELVDEVGAALDEAESGPVTALLVGPGGIGKTTLATAAAHQVAEHFPDGQLFADLRGSHANPSDPHDVLASFLRALGVAGSTLPDDTDERAALYRSLLADRHTLVLLDDASDEQQVRPLLPGGAGCAVFVTSRQRLGALIDTSRWTVPGLQSADAVDLLSRIVGRDRAGAEPEAAAAVVAACGGLPLAVSIAAARLAAHEEWSLIEFTERLTDERRRLDELRLGDLDVRASIALSYEALDPDHRRLLRRLGLVSAPDWPTWVAHEVVDSPDARQVETALDHLADTHLVEPLGRDAVGQTRFRLHDLVAEYARERAHAEETETDRTEVITRALAGWLALASEADQHLTHAYTKTSKGLTWPAPPAGATLPSADTASPWFETERLNLMSAVAQACEIRDADLAGGLAIRLAGYSTLHGHLDDQRRSLEAARNCVRRSGSDDLLERVLRSLCRCMVGYATPAELTEIATEWLGVARRVDDPCSLAHACVWMGVSMLYHGRLADAAEWLDHAKEPAERCDDPAARAWMWMATAIVRMESGRPADALAPMKDAIDIYRQLGGSHLTTVQPHNHGIVLFMNDRLSEAEAAFDESTQLATEAGNSVYVAHNVRKLAEIDMRRGDWSNAAAKLGEARRAYGAANDDAGLADVDYSFGDIALANGRTLDAIEHFERAVRTWRSIGVPLDVARLLARLELAHRANGDAAAADQCRTEWLSILDELELDEACLLLPPFLTDDGRAS